MNNFLSMVCYLRTCPVSRQKMLYMLLCLTAFLFLLAPLYGRFTYNIPSILIVKCTQLIYNDENLTPGHSVQVSTRFVA